MNEKQQPDPEHQDGAAVQDVHAAPPKQRSPRRGGPAYYYGHTSAPGYYSQGYAGSPAYGDAPYGGEAGPGGGDSFLGPMSLGRILRVVSQKWPSLIVAVFLGLGIGFAYYKTATPVYRSTSTIEMQPKRPRVMKTEEVIINDPDSSGTLNEIINTRLAKLRSREVILLVADRIRAEYPAFKEMTDNKIIELLVWSVDLKPRRMTRLIDISARHSDPKITASIANAYADTAESFSIEENRAASDAGVKWLLATADEKRRAIEKSDQDVLDFRVDNNIDEMENQKRAVDSVLLQLHGDLARAEVEQSRGADLLAVLNDIRKNPDKIGSLPENVPRSSEIAEAQAALQNAITERDALLTRFTDKHPEVVQLNTRVDVCRQQYVESVFRARETAAANLDLMVKQTESLRERTKVNEKLSAELDLKLIAAKARLDQLLRDHEAANFSYRGVQRRTEEARLAIDDSSASVRVIEKAGPPPRPISPDPRIAFSTGPLLGLLAGFLFIMLIDRLEDRITGVADIERHMSAKILALIPHVPHIDRKQLTKLCSDKKFSSFAEAFAGLRGLLTSPRYSAMSQVLLVVSTQPEEGKTIIASNLAMTYAMAGQKTLLVDFDLRRPRIGRMFDKDCGNGNAPSLITVLDAADTAAFDGLPISSGYDNLDLVTSQPDSRISPATIMGSDTLTAFFDWARKNYQRIVVDSPPFGLVNDAMVLGTLCDAVVIVCRPDRSRYRAIRHALRSLMESGSSVIGVVVNDVDFASGSNFSNYSYSRNYGYGSYGRYGRYGRYGYGYGSYHRKAPEDTGDKMVSKHAGSVEASSVLDVDDDEPTP